MAKLLKDSVGIRLLR